MADKKDPITQLQELADRLETAHKEAGDRVAEKVQPIDDAIQRIGIAYHFGHYAEQLMNQPAGDARLHRHCFAVEVERNGADTEYALCAARDLHRTVRLFVSVCRSKKVPQTEEEQEALVVVEEKKMLRPNELALPIRVKMLDELDAFVEAYIEHVEQDREFLLTKR